jgi:hypothetical protein
MRKVALRKVALVVVLTIALALGVAWIVGAQRPEPPPPPPLPDTSRLSAPSGATPTPAPNERRPDDVSPPTVTPIPFKEVIDKTDGTVPSTEEIEIIVHKGDGYYIKITMSEEQLNNLKAKDLKDLASLLGLSPKDEIIGISIPASLMMRQIPRPTP